ncbi:hypothetical protein N7450_010341 [Penicillium hetheringtonii]|uniref:Uncharacterized protein n=1 Tax=Penicillium hetheringtonii TaxID=911720 RepID=A0AAD6D8U1_9EURO|nr:hypothetical protein N7450_010341 [Penicillium hetheringtonii]
MPQVYEGVISVIGFPGGVKAEDQPSVMDTLSNICTVRGVYVDSKALMRDMNRAIEANDIHPVVDETVFRIDQARQAYEYMWAQAFWKVDDQGQLRNDMFLQYGESLDGQVTLPCRKGFPD